jgi:hypothetical protein
MRGFYGVSSRSTKALSEASIHQASEIRDLRESACVRERKRARVRARVIIGPPLPRLCLALGPGCSVCVCLTLGPGCSVCVCMCVCVCACVCQMSLFIWAQTQYRYSHALASQSYLHSHPLQLQPPLSVKLNRGLPHPPACSPTPYTHSLQLPAQPPVTAATALPARRFVSALSPPQPQLSVTEFVDSFDRIAPPRSAPPPPPPAAPASTLLLPGLSGIVKMATFRRPSRIFGGANWGAPREPAVRDGTCVAPSCASPVKGEDPPETAGECLERARASTAARLEGLLSSEVIQLTMMVGDVIVTPVTGDESCSCCWSSSALLMSAALASGAADALSAPRVSEASSAADAAALGGGPGGRGPEWTIGDSGDLLPA